MERKELVDRRIHKRFKVQDGALALLRANIRKVGQIIDISRGGLAFRYMSNGERLNGSFELDILLANNGFRLEKVPIKSVSDFEIANETSFSSITMRRLCAQFGELKHNQISQLEYFILNYTTGKA